MVNVVHRADAVAAAEQVADRSEHIVDDDGLGDQVVDAGLDGLFHILARNAGLNDLLEAVSYTHLDVYKRQGRSRS